MKKLFLIRRIVGGSMLPRLTPGQIVFGLRPRQLRMGDVVILHHDGLEKIKRVDRIDGDQVYVLGDNPQASTDSRQFGCVTRADILARIVWPKV